MLQRNRSTPEDFALNPCQQRSLGDNHAVILRCCITRCIFPRHLWMRGHATGELPVLRTRYTSRAPCKQDEVLGPRLPPSPLTRQLAASLAAPLDGLLCIS